MKLASYFFIAFVITSNASPHTSTSSQQAPVDSLLPNQKPDPNVFVGQLHSVNKQSLIHSKSTQEASHSSDHDQLLDHDDSSKQHQIDEDTQEKLKALREISQVLL